MKLLFLILLGFMTSCANMILKPLPPQSRTTTKTQSLGKGRQEAYLAVLAYMSKQSAIQDTTIKMSDKESGRIIANLSDSCPGLKRPDVINSPRETKVNYTVDISTSQKTLKIEVVMDGFLKETPGYGVDKMFIAEAQDQEANVEHCNNLLINKIVSSIDQ